MAERHFTPGVFEFLRELTKHNDREWFAAHREPYVSEVEGPLLQFIGDFAPRLKAISPAYVADRRRMGGSLSRIYRDTRFSPDKSPFKTYMAMRFPHESRRKVAGVPSFYLRLAPGSCFAGGGVYHLEMPALTRIRRHIVDQPREWAAIRQRVDGQGEQLKRAPAGFPSSHEHIEDLKRKNLFALAEFSESDVVAAGFLDRFTAACERAAPLVEFQTKALGLRW